MKIGVSGASGHLGRGVIAELQARAAGHEIVAISRTPETAPAGVAGRFGDYDQPASLALAYAGLDRLLLIPTAATRKGLRGAQNLAAIDAAVRAGVGHVVLMSSAGTRNRAEPHILAAYFAAEQRLMATAPKWTVLRMNYYAETLVQEIQGCLAAAAPLTGLAENRVGFVSRRDVAAAAAGILAGEDHDGEDHDGAIYTATGPAALTGAERAALAVRVAGKPLAFQALPAGVLAQGLAGAGLPPDIVGLILAIQETFAEGGFDIVTGDVARLSGREPTTLAAVFQGLLG